MSQLVLALLSATLNARLQKGGCRGNQIASFISKCTVGSFIPNVHDNNSNCYSRWMRRKGSSTLRNMYFDFSRKCTGLTIVPIKPYFLSHFSR